jgi:hypothetical protein
MPITYQTGDGKNDNPFQPHAPGEYPCTVVAAKETRSKSGNPMIEIRIRAIESDGQAFGPGIFDYLVFTDGAKWKVDAFLQSADLWPGEHAPINIEAEDLIGKTVTAKLGTEKGTDGVTRNKVETYISDAF